MGTERSANSTCSSSLDNDHLPSHWPQPLEREVVGGRKKSVQPLRSMSLFMLVALVVAAVVVHGPEMIHGAGECEDAFDCNEWNPCCSLAGYCGTEASGHCSGAVTIDNAGQLDVTSGWSGLVNYGRAATRRRGGGGGGNRRPGFGGR